MQYQVLDKDCLHVYKMFIWSCFSLGGNVCISGEESTPEMQLKQGNQYSKIPAGWVCPVQLHSHQCTGPFNTEAVQIKQVIVL